MNKIQVKLPGGVLVLGPDCRFTFQGDVSEDEVVLAETMAQKYRSRYGPSLGEPGYLLAEEVARKLGGEAVLPPLPPAEKGMVY